MALRKEKKRLAPKIMAWFVVITMVASVFGIVLDYAFGGSKQKYGKFTFGITDKNQYITTIEGKRLLFNYYPTELEELKMAPEISGLANNAQILLVTFNPENASVQDLYFMEVVRYDLTQQLNKEVFLGIAKPDEKYRLPLITCENATAYAPIIVLETGNKSNILLENNCIHLQGSQQLLIKSYNRFLYGYYGVIAQ